MADQESGTEIPGLTLSQYDIVNAKSLDESFAAIPAFCGLIAGFEAFVINEYVEKEIKDEIEYNDEFRAGLFIFIVSFALNVAAAITAFLFGLFVKERTYKECFMTRIIVFHPYFIVIV